MTRALATYLFSLLLAVPAWAQLDFGTKENFLELVAPIITRQERDIYKSLADSEARKYFSSIFWYKRDPDPDTNDNPYRAEFYERRNGANARFAEGGKPGMKTDRGLAYMLLGEPDDVKETKLGNSGARPGREEIWIYHKHGLTLRFIYDGLNPYYRLRDKTTLTSEFEGVRNRQVLDRAEPYVRNSKPLTLPNLGFTMDVENMVADDVHELRFMVNYAFFQGDLNRTEVLVGMTFEDASVRGMDIHLAAFDPYNNKVKEIKKLVTPENGKFLSFTIPLEPDQYNMVLRLTDKDGRKDISRRVIDVPRMAAVEAPVASSILLARGLVPIPLFGFSRPKKYVFGSDYFPVENDFRNFSGDRLYLMQIFYKYATKPMTRYYLDEKEVPARIEKLDEEKGVVRTVISLPLSGTRRGRHHIKAVYPDEAGNLSVTTTVCDMGPGNTGQLLLERAAGTERFKIIHPVRDEIIDLDRVALRLDKDLEVSHMYVYLNNHPILEQDHAPWEVTVDEGLFSISGDNTLAVLLQTSEGLIKRERILKPLHVKERISSRVVQISFNAFTEDLEFVTELDFSKLEVKVDGQPHTPLEIEKVQEPITYCFLVDTSFSMKDSFNENISALKRFIESMRPRDSGYFVTFSDNYQQYLEPTSSKAVLSAVAGTFKLDRPNAKYADRIYGENRTYLYDATISAIHTLLQYSGRTVILLVSDGVGVEGIYSKNGMLSYARENDTIIYSLWLDNNPSISDDDLGFLQTERGAGEKFARKIGLSRFFAKKDARTVLITRKVTGAAINEGMLKIVSEQSGGFHYRVFRADRTLIQEYVKDIENAVNSQFKMSLSLPLSASDQEVRITTSEEDIRIRNKSVVRVRKSPLQEFNN